MISINRADCDGCGLCIETCPRQAVQMVEGLAHIDQERCDGCEVCIEICPTGAIMRGELVVSPPRQPISVSPTRSRPTSALAAVGLTLVNVGLEILPRVLDILSERALSRADRPQTQDLSRSSGRGYGVGAGGRGRRRSRSGRGSGAGGTCVCPACGHRAHHRAGAPCRTLTCPQCGIALRRY